MHALNAVATQHDSALEGPVRNSVFLLAQRQSNASCLWESGSPNLTSQDRQTLIDLFERTNIVEQQNIYKLGTIALLCGSRPLPSSEARGFSTIEDYMFGWLWRAVQQNSPVDEIAKLGEIIRSFGPDYFGNEESGGWSYALPLIASQQFKTALSYLADAGGPMGLLQATHLAIILSLANVPVTDIGDNAPTECIVTALLVAYASRLEMETVAAVEASLEYLLQIPSKERMINEVRLFFCTLSLG
jgi:nuclear pore complex protein Nup93